MPVLKLQGPVLDATEDELRQLLVITERLFTSSAISWLLDWATGNQATMPVDGPKGTFTVSATVASVVWHYQEMLQEGW